MFYKYTVLMVIQLVFHTHIHTHTAYFSGALDFHSLMAFLSLTSHITFKARPSIMEPAHGKIM